ncbi:MAG: hypothetical protein CMN28_06125 [Salinisphaeraceae bacterium]|nr:hypothetical protein [Salinisphaeraceae bacterium]
MNAVSRALMTPLVAWLTEESARPGQPLCDYARICEKLQPSDVLLVEGRTRVSGVIQAVTLSSWSHAALYIGTAGRLRERWPALARHRLPRWADDEHLLVEAELGQGTVIMPLSRYRDHHLRICRPAYLTEQDSEQVIQYAVQRLGTRYDLRQILDLLRFFFPYGLLPRRWRSSLFAVSAGEPTRTVCSTLIARAFSSVDYPVLPRLERQPDGRYAYRRRNPKLFTPRDFDYSPYFNIIKYPFMGEDAARYREMDWLP